MILTPIAKIPKILKTLIPRSRSISSRRFINHFNQDFKKRHFVRHFPLTRIGVNQPSTNNRHLTAVAIMLKCRIISSRRRCRRHDPAPRADLSSSHRAEKLGHRPAGTRPPLLPFRGCDVRARTRTQPLRCRARPFPSIHLPISIVFKRV